MCGIVGFTGRENALPILIKGLYSLEYRGYDSAGVAAFTKDGLRVVKARGRIAKVWSVVHFTDYLLYTLPGGVTNTAFMIDNIGNCGNRYVAGFCNFFYGRHGNLLPFFLLY